MDGRQRGTAAVALLGALLSTLLLHTSPDRTAAAQLVPIVVLWGAAVLLSAREAPPLSRVLTVAALVRALLVGSPPLLSDDLYRYLWEGRVLLAGQQPLYESPMRLAALDPALAALVNHPELPSVYPPLAMAWFAFLALLGSSVTGVQLATALVDVASVAALYRLHRRGSWLYALLPLPAVEAAVGAHIDVPAITLAVWAMVVLRRKEAGLGGIGLVLASVLTKLFPLAFLPTVWWRLAPRRRVPVALGALGVGSLSLLPFVRWQLPPGLVAYSTKWSFNGLVHLPLEALVGTAARPLLVGLGGLAFVGVALRIRSPLVAWAVMGAAFVALTPTMHPWYLLWALVPSLALGRREVAAASVFVPVSYSVLATLDPETGRWSAGAWLWGVTWIPALLAAGWVVWVDGPTGEASKDPSPEAPS